MNQDQMRHWLAMHCPAGAADRIFDEMCMWNGNKSFEERHGVKPTSELARYIWADRMLSASTVQIIERAAQ